jgi:hypothetical protein
MNATENNEWNTTGEMLKSNAKNPGNDITTIKSIRRKKWNRTYYLKHREKLRINNRHRKIDYCLKYRFKNWKHSAKRRNIFFNIKITDLENMPLRCYYTNRELTFDPNMDNTISLDRLDNTKGYVRDNVVYCCSIINFMKSELSYDAFIDNCNLILKNHLLKHPM